MRRATTSCSTRRRSRRVKLESKKTLELTQFVDADEIDAIYFDKPYYVVPADDLAEEAFIVLREALRRDARRSALGQLAMRGREYVVSLKPCGRGLVLETLRYADEVNKARDLFPRHRRRQARRGPARSRHHADREEDRASSTPASSTTATSMRCRI